MSIGDAASQRGVTEVLHYTTNHGVVGILDSRFVLARQRLKKEATLEYLLASPESKRKDREWFDYVNLSITRINAHLFGIASGNWHANADLWWCLLSFRPEILDHDGVRFGTTNNIYTGVRRDPGVDGFEALFVAEVPQYVGWGAKSAKRPPDLADNLTTCHQAEVLYPGALSTEFLQRIYVVRPEHSDIVIAQCDIVGHPHPEIVVEPSKFS